MANRKHRLKLFFSSHFVRMWMTGLIIVVVSAVIALLLVKHLSLTVIAENYLSDIRVAYFSPLQAQSHNIAVVLIDEDSLSNLPYRSPMDRELISRLIAQIERRKPIAIGINIIFERATETEKDRMLYDRLHQLDVPLVVSGVSDINGFNQSQVDYATRFLRGVSTGLSVIYQDAVDRVVRNALIRLKRDGETHFGFAASIAKQLEIALPPQNSIRIDYLAPQNPHQSPFPVYSASQIGSLPDRAFENRIVLVGARLYGSLPLQTPLTLLGPGLSSNITGTEMEAHVLAQLLEGRSFKMASSREEAGLTLMMAVFGCLLALLRFSLGFKLSMFLLLPFAWLNVMFGYPWYGYMLPMLVPTVSFVLALILGALWQWRHESHKRELLHQAFGQYLAPNVVAQIAKNPNALRLSGETREISFLFTDLEGFTRLTETSSPEVMVALVNANLDEACEIVMRHGGTIDKIVGDALHVMFNAPFFQNDHACMAVQCAIELDQWAQDFKTRRNAEGIALGVTRIGVNTGRCVVGNFGGSQRFDYTAHGDAINTSARLEAANKLLGTTLCISESTVEACDGRPFRPLAKLILPGKKKWVGTYAPVDEKTQTEEFIQQYLDAYELMKNENPLALTAFQRLQKECPEDKLVSLHVGRLLSGQSGETISLC